VRFVVNKLVMEIEEHIINVPEIDKGKRLDAFIASKLTKISRSRIAHLIEDGFIKINGEICRRRAAKLKGNEKILAEVPPLPGCPLEPVNLNLKILYEDEFLAVINKPPGLVVHPASGVVSPTLVHGLLYKFPEMSNFDKHGRPGIVHRLDKGTSGCIMIAKSEEARLKLSDLFARHDLKKEYFALIKGILEKNKICIDEPISRNIHNRTKMCVNERDGRSSKSFVTVNKNFGKLACAVDVQIVTGRTHQIRVHLAHIGHPVLGDATYGNAAKEINEKFLIPRQMLHARKLTFVHPFTKKECSVESPLPEDMRLVMKRLENQ